MRLSPDALSRRVVRLRNAFATEGMLRRIVLHDRRARTDAVALVPVLALHSDACGRAGHIDPVQAAILSGVSTARLEGAVRVLQELGALESGALVPRSLSFTLAAGTLLSNVENQGAFLPGMLLHQGRWASLPRPAKAVLLALCVLARQEYHEFEGPEPVDETQDEWDNLVREYGSSDKAGTFERSFVPRCGAVSIADLGWMSGLRRRCVLQALARLDRDRGGWFILMIESEDDDGCIVHLTSPAWVHPAHLNG
jgi:hypothetical protein